MEGLLRDYRAHIARLRDDDVPLTSYDCPTCRRTIEARIPKPGRVFDSLVVCPYCEQQHIKAVDSDGRVTAEEV